MEYWRIGVLETGHEVWDRTSYRHHHSITPILHFEKRGLRKYQVRTTSVKEE